MPANKNIRLLHNKLLRWYRKEKRDLPWRKSADPYPIWVSEIMLQQTQVKTVIPYYRRWIKSFPTVKRLAAANEGDVLKHWEGLGYYSRARNLHQAARIVVEKFGGRVPESRKELMALPGIGRYTVGAILSIAFNQPTPVLDGNVKRVLSRLFCLKENGKSGRSENRLWTFSESLLPGKHAGDFNQAMMELGATVCLPKSPDCPRCPLAPLCQARTKNVLQQYPPPPPRPRTKKIEVSAGVISRNGKTYIQQRLMKGLMGGLWEFPGGKIEKGETPEACLIREIKEELGVGIVIEEKLMTVKHSYTRFRVTLHVFRCRVLPGRLRPCQCEQWKWVKPENLASFPFPAANVKIVEYLNQSPWRQMAKPVRQR